VLRAATRTATLAAAVVLLGPLLAGCRSVEGVPSAAAGPPVPASAAELGALVVPDVPSGLPRVPDADLRPPAGAKTVDDVAGYAADPERERQVLGEYGYRFGWERYWSGGRGRFTSVFVHQFAGRAGAVSFTEDLARNDGDVYSGQLLREPPSLPGGCWLLEVDDPAASARPAARQLGGPTAFAWCAHGPFAVAVTAVAGDRAAASAELHAVVTAQLGRLPPS
jgi:hypothetical protein